MSHSNAVLMQISPRRRITSGWLLISCGRKIKRLLYLLMTGTTSWYLVSDTVIDEHEAKSSLPASMAAASYNVRQAIL